MLDLNESNSFDQLADCTVKMLEILIFHFESGKISFDDFKKNTQIKIAFLEANLNKLNTDSIKNIAINVLKNCSRILQSQNI